MVLEFITIIVTFSFSFFKPTTLNKLSDGDIYFLYKAEAPEMFGTEILYSETEICYENNEPKNVSRGLG